MTGMTKAKTAVPYVLVPGWPIYLTVKFNHPDLVSGVSFTFGETRLQASLKNGVYQAITDGGAVGPIGIDYTTKEPADSFKGPPPSAATAVGIVKGADGKFRPTDPITREEMAVMLHRALGIVTDDLDPEKLLEAYSDRAKAAGWARLQVPTP